MYQQYIINRNTSALVSHFYKGYEYTKVLEGTDMFLVAQSPDQIVKESFLRMASSLDGAIESSQYVLKQKYKVPVVLSAKYHIALIRCPSSDKSSTIWLIDSHIDRIGTDPDHHNKTFVHMKNGYLLTVDMKCNKLQTLRTQAAHLISFYQERTVRDRTITFFYDKDNGFQRVKTIRLLNDFFKKKNDGFDQN